MAAASLTLIYRLTNGSRIAYNGYASDAAAVAVKFDQAKVAVAGSDDHIVAPGPGHVIDVCFTTDLATPTHVVVTRNGKNTGDILDVTAHLASVVTRPAICIPFNANEKIGLTQAS